jgi:hypothetical protein
VRELLRAAPAIYHLDVDLLAELDPGLVVTFTIRATPTGPTCDRHFPSRASKMAPRRARLTASLPPRRRGACRDGRLLGVGQRLRFRLGRLCPLDPRVPAQAAFEVAR